MGGVLDKESGVAGIIGGEQGAMSPLEKHTLMELSGVHPWIGLAENKHSKCLSDKLDKRTGLLCNLRNIVPEMCFRHSAKCNYILGKIAGECVTLKMWDMGTPFPRVLCFPHSRPLHARLRQWSVDVIMGCGRLRRSSVSCRTGKSCTTSCTASSGESPTTDSWRTYARQHWAAPWRPTAATSAHKSPSRLRALSTPASRNTDVSMTVSDEITVSQNRYQNCEVLLALCHHMWHLCACLCMRAKTMKVSVAIHRTVTAEFISN